MAVGVRFASLAHPLLRPVRCKQNGKSLRSFRTHRPACNRAGVELERIYGRECLRTEYSILGTGMKASFQQSGLDFVYLFAPHVGMSEPDDESRRCQIDF